MYALHCTKPLLRTLGFGDSLKSQVLPPPTTRLGNWYAKPLIVEGEALILCTSELSLLSVLVPASDVSQFPISVMQALEGLLREMGLAPGTIERETNEMLQLHFAPTASRSVLAHMNDFAYHVDVQFSRTKGTVYLGRIAERLADIPIGTRGYAQPRELALKLLAAAS